MPRRDDLRTILLIGSGPIVIGQACEFDYSGTQACKALRDDGYRVVLVNSNPATIMTDPETADRTYIEPLTWQVLEKVIAEEKPDAVLPTLGGQTALNLAMDLEHHGVLKKYGVEMIGARAEAIQRGEDREQFKSTMEKIGLDTCRGRLVKSLEEAREILSEIGLPAVIRPSFTLGGSGSGVAYNREEFDQKVQRGLDLSPVSEVLVEESILGWKEYEMEVVRDKADNCIIICSIENVDPMGVHTGDSITVAPALTLTDREYQIMRNASIAVLREIGVETGGSNVQFAINPVDGRLVIIEMNPRVSRSSALASKATGFPIAKIAAKLAVGYTLDEISNDITGITPASFEPTIDYVVTKIPRFAFEKFPGSEPVLTTAMKSVGESMAIGRCFEESLQKALRSLETGLTGLNEKLIDATTDQLHAALKTPTPDRLLHIADALRADMSEEEICTLSGFNPWFVARLKNIIDMEAKVRKFGLPKDIDNFRSLKKLGLSDCRLAELTGTSEIDVRNARHALDLRPKFRRIDTCAAEFAAQTPYLYSSYETISPFDNQNEAEPSSGTKAVILGGGPNRIGQGIEFDYCCCHAAYAMGDIEIESIMVNCNPET
ncbi:MAG TPA: carbamoyl phosphate synthase large subunit, partial [Planctomycetaceae bacterium]|nr:carbamoyl phosphate synthase large subunit [Planctomycetaceae bacterium]